MAVMLNTLSSLNIEIIISSSIIMNTEYSLI